MQSTINNYDKLYEQRVARAKYPNEMLIRFINSKFRYSYEQRKSLKILDLGSGTGRHLVYLAQEGFDSYGIEGSANGASTAKEWLNQEGLNATILVDSFKKIQLDDNQFDAVIDIASVQHNEFDDIKNIVDEIYRVLKPGGYAFSYTKNKADSLYSQSVVVDGRNRIISAEAEKADTNLILCFLSKSELRKLFSKFSMVNIEEETWSYNNMANKVSHWVVTAQK